MAEIGDDEVEEFERTFQTRLRKYSEYSKAESVLGIPWGDNLMIPGKKNYRNMEDSFQYSYKDPSYNRNALAYIFQRLFAAQQQLAAFEARGKMTITDVSVRQSSNTQVSAAQPSDPPPKQDSVPYFNTDFQNGVKPGSTIILPPPKPIPGLTPP